MWHELNEYEINVYKNIEKLEFGKWYRIDPIRPDRLALISAIKKRIDMHYDCVFDDDGCNWFSRCHTIPEFTENNIEKERGYWREKVKNLK